MSEFVRKGIDNLHRNVLYPLYLTRGEAQVDREIAHERALRLMAIGQIGLLGKLTHEIFTYKDPILEMNIGGVVALNPFEFPAGFDKNVLVPDFLGDLGAGIVTVGSITKVPFKGNQRPRIYDL